MNQNRSLTPSYSGLVVSLVSIAVVVAVGAAAVLVADVAVQVILAFSEWVIERMVDAMTEMRVSHP